MGYPFYNEPSHLRGTATSSTGMRNTDTSATEGIAKVDAADKIFLLTPNKNPLLTLFTNIGKTASGGSWNGVGLMKSVTGNSTFDCFEDVYGGRWAKVSGTYTTADSATVTVTGAGSSPAYIFTVGDVVMNSRTGERMQVATISGANTITVTKRGIGTSTELAGADGDDLYIIGNANEEGAGVRNVNATVKTKGTNYTQIFKKTVSTTGTQDATDTYGGNTLQYDMRKASEEHALDKLMSTVSVMA